MTKSEEDKKDRTKCMMCGEELLIDENTVPIVLEGVELGVECELCQDILLESEDIEPPDDWED